MILAALGLAQAAILRVPADQTSLQAAIDAAVDGDQIEAAPGTYYEQINFNGKAVRLYGRDGPGATAIDGIGIGPVVRCVSGEGTGTVLDGFKHSRYVVFQMAEVIVPRALLREILERIGRLRASPGFAEVG